MLWEMLGGRWGFTIDNYVFLTNKLRLLQILH